MIKTACAVRKAFSNEGFPYLWRYTPEQAALSELIIDPNGEAHQVGVSGDEIRGQVEPFVYRITVLELAAIPQEQVLPRIAGTAPESVAVFVAVQLLPVLPVYDRRSDPAG